MENNAYIKLFRVQGGQPPNRSRKFIRLGKDGKPIISGQSVVHVGDMEHMIQFLFKRLGIERVEEITENIKEKDVHVIEMLLPYWYVYLLKTYAVNQFSAKGHFPQLVDKTMPGNAFAIKGPWNSLLCESCICARDILIESKETIDQILYYPLRQGMLTGQKACNAQQIGRLIEQCKIKENDIMLLEKVWGVKRMEELEKW